MSETTMRAQVMEVQEDALLVCDQSTGQQVQVHTPCARCYAAGDHICIHYNGVMTASLPPQISAQCIHKVSGCC